MSLSAGSRLGRYEILTPLGAGGMGEVYRARDTRLDRDVAIKILPASVSGDPERLARFDREAKAVAALSHPNILALHDAGTENGITFAVMELLEGETLRDRLSHGPLPIRRAIETAVQIARGLAAAHAKALVHRDLKPENVFLVADGQVKILDFGLAKAADPGADGASATATHAPAMTDPGTVLGTVGYMAPEQVRGHALDARTDLFALGAVLYEMVAGDRAFRRDTAAETMTAILREDVPDLPQPLSAQAPALDRIIRHCLEKSPSERFQSARDVAFALEALSGTTGTTGTTGATGTRNELSRVGFLRSRVGFVAAALALVVVAGAAAWAAGFVHFGAAPAGGAGLAEVTYQPVTFEEGFVFAARFAREGRTIVYSADWENQTRDIFETSLDSSGARALGYKGADLLSVSSEGSLAILLDGIVPAGNPYGRLGTIARASLTGGAPRRELDQVTFADFAPDQSLAVTRSIRQKRSADTLEWPQGQPIPEPDGSALFVNQLVNPRVSPSGSHIAFFTCHASGCPVRIVDRSGRTVAESKAYADWWGLAWAPGGREVWFAVAETNGRQCALRALDLSGRERLILRTPGAVTVHDISADGRLLAAFDQVTGRMEFRDSRTVAPRDLSWKEGGRLEEVSRNGVVLFDEPGDSAGPSGSVYVRRPADPEPVRISDGTGVAISEDGAMTLVRSHATPIRLTIVPTTGLAQPLDVGPLDDIHAGGWLKDGRLVLELRRPGESGTVYVRPAGGGPLARLLPIGMHIADNRPFSDDGQRVAAANESGQPQVCAIPAAGEGTCAPLAGLNPGDLFAGWAADNRSVFVYRRYPVPVRVERLDVATGRRELFATVQPATAAVSGLRSLIVTPDGAIVYNYGRSRSALYVISGLK